MPSITIYGITFSTCTKRVAVVAKELGIDYKIVPVDITKGAQKAPEFVAHQPFGQVPYIVDDQTGVEVYESRAIARYLATTYGKGKLIPSETAAYVKFEIGASVESANYDPFAAGFVAETYFGPIMGRTVDEKKAEYLKTTLDAKLDGYERILSKQKYIGGDEVTLADLFHLPYGQLLTEACKQPHLTDAKRPNVVRWWKDITSRPSWQAVAAGA